MEAVNFWAVLIAAIASIVLGFLWYGPLFGKVWIRLMNVTPEQIAEAKQKGMQKIYLLNFVSALVMAYVMGHAFLFGASFTGARGFSAAFGAAFWNWLGFIAPVLLGGVLWEKKSWKWWLLLAGYYLVSLILQGIVFSLFMIG